ncbi:MAG: methyltransferase domain-containing protein [Sulfolobales archaeon]
MILRRDLAKKIYALISLDRVEQALAEVENFARGNALERIYVEPGLILFEKNQNQRELIGLERLSLIKDLGETLYVFEDIERVEELYESISLVRESIGRPEKLYIRVLREKYIKPDPSSIRRILEKSSTRDFKQDLSLSIIVGDVIVIGRSFYRRKISSWRSPERDGSATMKDIDTRFMSSMISTEAGNTYDPFSGGGYLIYEVCKNGVRVIASDIDEKKIFRTRSLLEESGCVNYDLFVGDALKTPIRDGGIDAIVSDIPYGRRSKLISKHSSRALEKLIDEINRVLKSRGEAVIACSYEQWNDLRRVLDPRSIRSVSLQYVHKSLYRVYVSFFKS